MRALVPLLLGLFLAPLLTAVSTVPLAAPAQAAPGVPEDPTVLYVEDFENGASTGVQEIETYAGSSGMTYTADSYWRRAYQCNGFIVQFTNVAQPPQHCGNEADEWEDVRRMAWAMGLLPGGTGDNNRAVSSRTTGCLDSDTALGTCTGTSPLDQAGGAGQVEIATTGQLNLPSANGRFITFSVDAAASCSHRPNQPSLNSEPKLRFFLRRDDNTEVRLTNPDINPCTAPNSQSATRLGSTVLYGRFVSNNAVLLSGSSFGIVMRNMTATSNGNDHAFDNIRVLDATPSLDKAFAPTLVPVGGVSRLTLTVTNTSELGAKSGWAFTDTLPDGLVLADSPDFGGTCLPRASAAGAPGSPVIQVTGGELAAGEVSCTISVNVTSDTPRGADPSPKTYANCAGNISDIVGLNPPECAEVTFFSTPALTIEKTSDATSGTRMGDTVAYEVTATNTGTGDFTAADPAIVTDDLTGVLDDGTYNQDASASRGSAPAYVPAQEQLRWSGALPVGESVTIRYTVTLDKKGDRHVRNVAFDGDDDTPECTEPDPTCDVEEFDLPALTVAKSASRTHVAGAGQEVEYEVLVTNVGPGAYTAGAPAVMTDDLSDVLDVGELVAGSVTATSGNASVNGTTLTWSGALAAQASATITYRVRYVGGLDETLENVACVPVSQTPPNTPECDEVAVPHVNVSKSAVPASGSTVIPGQLVDYTLTFDNPTAVAAPIAYDDVISGVLDDADVIVAPASVPAGELTVSAIDNGRFSITGTLDPGETVQVTYRARVKPDGQRGDNLLKNFVVEPTEDPPPNCVDGDPLCTKHPVVTIVKMVDPVKGSTVKAGDELTYTLRFSNDSSETGTVDFEDVVAGVLDDAVVITQPASVPDGELTVSAIADGRFSITGTLDPGETVEVTYRVRVLPDDERGDDLLKNFVVETGEDPDPVCEDGDPLCTKNPIIGVAKSVDPQDGSTVVAGQVLTYTLTFSNQGTAPGQVDFEDLLSGVLDDATVVSDPVADPAGQLTVSPIANQRFRVNGTLDPGEVVTVTYKVKVKADNRRGDNFLVNFVIRTGEEPPEECVDGDPLCTENPVPQIAISKDVDPSDGSLVEAGQVLTYKLRFENTGKATAKVDHYDDLADVLDDADFVTGSIDGGGLKVAGPTDQRLHITGRLKPGEVVVVTYQVKVREAGERGNDLLENFLLEPGQENPPPNCPDGDPLCTKNPVPDPPDDGGGPPLPNTGGASLWLLLLGLILGLAGTGVAAWRVRSR